MKKSIITFLATLCLIVPSISAQSFETLKRSKSKSSLYSAVEQTLAGKMNVAECRKVIATGSLTEPYDGKTPIYLVLGYIATHKKSDCNTAEQIMEAIFARKDFDVNLRHGKLPPPLAYLIRSNFEYLGNRFSKDYISDNVIQIMINAGASVNTYLTDGCTLMDFAAATDNVYLQKFLINQGIDLRHKSNTGEDVVYRLIAEGKSEAIKHAVESGKIQIDINSLKNEPSSFAQHIEMYNYLASLFAKQVETYDDIVHFRSRFPDRKEYVLQKYETIAQKEVSLADDYYSIMTCKKRFPDLENITGPKFEEIAHNELKASSNIAELKVCENRYPHLKSLIVPKRNSFYLSDSKKLDSSYSHAQDLVRRGSFNYNSRMANVAFDFDNYYKNYYDPDNRLPLATDLSNFYSALSDVNEGYHTSLINLPNPGIANDVIKGDKERLNRAYNTLSRCGHNLRSQYMLETANRVYQKAQESADKSIREYRAFCETLRKKIKVTKHEIPSGELSRGLLETYYHHSENGKIDIDFNLPNYYCVIHVYYDAYYYDRSTIFEDQNLEFQYYKIGLISTYKVDINRNNILNDVSTSDEYRYGEYKSTGDLERDVINRIIKYYYSFL